MKNKIQLFFRIQNNRHISWAKNFLFRFLGPLSNHWLKFMILQLLFEFYALSMQSANIIVHCSLWSWLYFWSFIQLFAQLKLFLKFSLYNFSPFLFRPFFLFVEEFFPFFFTFLSSILLFRRIIILLKLLVLIKAIFRKNILLFSDIFIDFFHQRFFLKILRFDMVMRFILKPLFFSFTINLLVLLDPNFF